MLKKLGLVMLVMLLLAELGFIVGLVVAMFMGKVHGLIVAYCSLITIPIMMTLEGIGNVLEEIEEERK